MTNDQIQGALFAAIQHVAPEAEPATVAPGADLREELDLDSMDFLNVIVHLHEALGVDIPERDYARLFTVGDAVEYLSGRLAAGGAR